MNGCTMTRPDGLLSHVEAEPQSPEWSELVELEPRVLTVEADAKARRRPRGRADDFDYEAVKGAIGRLVGWDCRHPELATCSAFDAALDHLCKVMRY